MATVLNLDRLVLALDPNNGIATDQTVTNNLMNLGASLAGSSGDKYVDFSGIWPSLLYSSDENYYRLKPTSQLSLMMIITVEFDTLSQEERLLGKGYDDPYGEQVEYVLKKESDNTLSFCIYDTSNNEYKASTSITVSTGTKYFIVCGFENAFSSTGRAFIEVNKGTRNYSSATNAPLEGTVLNDLEIGSFLDEDLAGDFKMYGFWMFRRIVSSSELTYLYNSGDPITWDQVISDLNEALLAALSASASSTTRPYISGSDYLVIATKYANIKRDSSATLGYLFSALYHIVLTNELDVELDLVQSFKNSYQVNYERLVDSGNILSAVKRINDHVINRGGFADLDAYLDNEGIIVPREWADLSTKHGASISESNIE